MANEGYLIGYEDAQGNFVQIGQFNNAADDVTQPLVLRHTNSGETLELDGSSFRPSTQIGDTNNRPDLFANTVDLNTLVGAGLDTKADLTQSGGVLVASQLPDLAITNIDVVADQTARLALNAEEGDVAIQTDISETFILSTNDPTVNSNWKKVQLDVLGAIDGQTITPAQTGTSTNPTDVEAGNIEAGTIGSTSARPDLIADDVGPRSIASDYLYAGEFSGGDPDSRLSSCLNAASGGEVIYLERGDYAQSRTITTTGLRFVGAGVSQNGTRISATITLSAERQNIMHISLLGSTGATGEIVLDGGTSARHLVMDVFFGDVTINSGTERSIVAFARSSNLTDNGTNNRLVGNL